MNVILVLFLFSSQGREVWRSVIKDQRLAGGSADFIDFDQIVVAIVEQHSEFVGQVSSRTR